MDLRGRLRVSRPRYAKQTSSRTRPLRLAFAEQQYRPEPRQRSTCSAAADSRASVRGNSIVEIEPLIVRPA